MDCQCVNPMASALNLFGRWYIPSCDRVPYMFHVAKTSWEGIAGDDGLHRCSDRLIYLRGGDFCLRRLYFALLRLVEHADCEIAQQYNLEFYRVFN